MTSTYAPNRSSVSRPALANSAHDATTSISCVRYLGSNSATAKTSIAKASVVYAFNDKHCGLLAFKAAFNCASKAKLQARRA